MRALTCPKSILSSVYRLYSQPLSAVFPRLLVLRDIGKLVSQGSKDFGHLGPGGVGNVDVSSTLLIDLKEIRGNH